MHGRRSEEILWRLRTMGQAIFCIDAGHWPSSRGTADAALERPGFDARPSPCAGQVAIRLPSQRLGGAHRCVLSGGSEHPVQASPRPQLHSGFSFAQEPPQRSLCARPLQAGRKDRRPSTRTNGHLHKFRDIAATRWLRAGIDVRRCRPGSDVNRWRPRRNTSSPPRETQEQLDKMKLPSSSSGNVD
jgi:hypothetical protein